MALSDPTTDFNAAAEVLDSALSTAWRSGLVAELAKAKSYAEALARLRAAMRTHTFRTGTAALNLEKTVRTLDERTRADGFHVLHDWDGKASKLNKDIIPVDVLTYLSSVVQNAPPQRAGLAILLDYYFAYLLCLLALRCWDTGDPNAALDRTTGLLQQLQGEQGSGQRFAENAETLIFVATSHFEPDDSAYSRLLERVHVLDETHRLRVALVHGAILGSHLRFGFEAQYARDIGYMRSDNAPDYLWLCFALLTLIRTYARLHDDAVENDERSHIVECLLNALTTDTRAFTARPPASLTAMETQHAEFRELFGRYKASLMKEFEGHRPAAALYSPIAFNFNFPHNLLKAIVVDALLQNEPSAVSFNDFLSRFSGTKDPQIVPRPLIDRLLGYAQSSPDIIRGKPMPILTYDPYAGIRVFTRTMSILRE
jgi:hypothetical protein